MTKTIQSFQMDPGNAIEIRQILIKQAYICQGFNGLWVAQ